MIRKNLLENIEPEKIIDEGREEGQIPFFVIDEEYGVAVNDLCYMVVCAKKRNKTVEGGFVEKLIFYEPVSYVSTFAQAIESYVSIKEKKLNRKLLKSKDLTEIKNNQEEIKMIIKKALSTNGINRKMFDTVELVQAKEDIIKDMDDLKKQKERMLRMFNELESLIKEKRRIIIKQTEPTKHKYKEEEE